MHWFCKAFVWVLLIGGATASAQEALDLPPAARAIKLGQPTPLPADQPELQAAPRPRVVARRSAVFRRSA